MIGLASGTARVCVSTLCWQSISLGGDGLHSELSHSPWLQAVLQVRTCSGAFPQWAWGCGALPGTFAFRLLFKFISEGTWHCVATSTVSMADSLSSFNLSVKFRRVIKKCQDLAKLGIVKFMVQGQWRWCGWVWWAEAPMILKVVWDRDISKISWRGVLYPARYQHWYFML